MLKLSEANFSFKVLITFFLFMVGIAYIFGLINIYNNTGFSYTGLATHYRGEVDHLSIPPEFAFSKLVHIHHVHLFSLAMLYLMIGTIFTMTRMSEPVKVFFVCVPFIGLILDFTSFWLLVFVSPLFSFLAMLFGGLMALAFFLIICRPLYEMWILPIWYKRWPQNQVPWYLR